MDEKEVSFINDTACPSDTSNMPLAELSHLAEFAFI